MIQKILGLLLVVNWLQIVLGAAYSKVYLQNGAEVVPVEYVQYGAPRVITNGQIAALSAPPVGSALPLPNVLSPCVSPCTVPSQTVGTFAPVPSNAKLISYSTPSVPAVVVPAKDEKTSYEYSYIVYDENTGDRKAQRELSDGSVVQGEYSFIQPDGYIREVKYTADDLTGFNAVVKSFLPESVFGIDKNKPVTKEKSEPPPCKETKSEALKVDPEHGPVEASGVEHKPELSVVPVSHAEHAAPSATELSVEFHVEDAPVPIPSHAPEKAPKHNPESETPEEHAKHDEHNSEEIVHSTESKEPEPLHVVTGHEPISVAEASVQLIPAPKEDCGEKIVTHEAVQAPSPQVPLPNGLATYNDIIKCIQAAVAKRDSNAPNISPLTYIILPGANKPC